MPSRSQGAARLLLTAFAIQVALPTLGTLVDVLGWYNLFGFFALPFMGTLNIVQLGVHLASLLLVTTLALQAQGVRTVAVGAVGTAAAAWMVSVLASLPLWLIFPLGLPLSLLTAWEQLAVIGIWAGLHIRVDPSVPNPLRGQFALVAMTLFASLAIGGAPLEVWVLHLTLTSALDASNAEALVQGTPIDPHAAISPLWVGLGVCGRICLQSLVGGLWLERADATGWRLRLTSGWTAALLLLLFLPGLCVVGDWVVLHHAAVGHADASDTPRHIAMWGRDVWLRAAATIAAAQIGFAWATALPMVLAAGLAQPIRVEAGG